MTDPLPSDIAATLRASAHHAAAQVALRSGSAVVTYGELDQRVDAAAATLIAGGVAPGDRVAVMLGNRISMVVAIYATLRAGAVIVPINTALTSPEVAHQLTDCEATAMVVGRAYLDTVTALQGTLPALQQVYVADTTQPIDPAAGALSWSQALAEHGEPSGWPAWPQLASGDLALLAYTSGTTGSPKAASLSHANLLANQDQLARSGGALDPEDVVLTALPLFHSYALNVALGMTIAAGATLELVERFEPAGTLRRIADHRVTVVVGAPPMYVAWLNTPGADEVDLSHVRLATSGAAALPARVLQRCAEELSLDIREGYGMAEAGPVIASATAMTSAVPGCVGPPLEGVSLRIMDDDRPAEPGDPGIVWVRGAGVFAGYWKAPEATAQVLSDDGWLDTGDIGYLDGGRLYLVDRAKDVIIVSGFNVYPAEVERALASHHAVMQAAVVGVDHPYTGEAVKAFVVLAEDAEVTADELIAHTATRVARFKRPETIEFVPSLPTLPTGKVRRRMLRDPR